MASKHATFFLLVLLLPLLSEVLLGFGVASDNVESFELDPDQLMFVCFNEQPKDKEGIMRKEAACEKLTAMLVASWNAGDRMIKDKKVVHRYHWDISIGKKKENVVPISTKIAELSELRAKLVTRIQGLKQDLQGWQLELDAHVKACLSELSELKKSVNVEVEKLKFEFQGLRTTLQQQEDYVIASLANLEEICEKSPKKLKSLSRKEVLMKFKLYHQNVSSGFVCSTRLGESTIGGLDHELADLSSDFRANTGYLILKQDFDA
ncbi:hypothetical protein BVC80_8955g41 [Macleaya cordata]|uniref:Uncharacterized protein n=1 Tax=Macleaya cordata TaxID=56857 RepID=A0A200QWN4_MACCD|nr:hypothetical protein BVC80_8955g41 [Macleaya cordata]